MSELTIVNGAAGMLYTGRDVPFSRQNKVGYSTRRNLFNDTENFSVSGYTKNGGTVVSNSTPSPVGLGDSFIEDSSNGLHRIFRTSVSSSVSGTTYSTSLLVKPNGRSIVRLTLGGFSMVVDRGAEFNLATQQVTLLNSGTGTIEALENGWFRLSVSGVALASGQTVIPTFWLMSGNNTTYLGDGVSGVFLDAWHAQIGPITPYQRIGADPGANVLIPALLSDPTKSAATDPLTFSGEVPRNAQLEQANCFTFDGSDDRVAVDLSQWAGPELVTNGTFDSATGWIDSFESTISGGQLTLNAVATARRRQDNVTVNGRTYYFEIDVVSTSNSWRIDNAASSAISYGTFGVVSGIVRGTFVANSATNSVRFINLNTSGTVIVNSITVKQLPTPATVKTGAELASNPGGPFSVTTGWVNGNLNPTISVVSGRLRMTATADGTSRIVLPITCVIGRVYLISVNFEQGSVFRFTPSSNGSSTGAIIDASFTGLQTFTVTATATSMFLAIANTLSIGQFVELNSISIKEVAQIDSDGTSLLTYRSQGDGFTGTAGTAFNIRIGDVEHIPCSEGHGSVLHGTKLNQAYTVVNGQFSNWTANKQNTYHYNTAEGYSDALSDDAKIATLFANNEVGGWWDWSDRSTMFQDVFGTQPITASGQTRALHLDKSKGLVLGPELVNINSLPTPTIVNTAGTVGVWDAATRTMSNTVASTNNSYPRFQFAIPVIAGRHYRIEGQLSGDTTAVANVRTVNGGGFNISYNSANGVISGITNCGTSDFFEVALNGTLAVPINVRIESLSIRELPGNHRYQTSAASRPQYIEDETGHYGLYDGVDDWDETNAVDFTGTDKMTVWWGGRKLSDAAQGAAFEFNTTVVSAGSFGIGAPSSAGLPRYSLAGRSSAGSSSLAGSEASTFAAPTSNVLTGQIDYSLAAGNEFLLRVNGVEFPQSIGLTQENTGNIGNAKLFFGRRGGTSFPFNGREYMTIIRGAQTPTNMVQVVENIVADKVGLAEFHANPTPPTADFDVRLPASQTNPGFDVLGNPLTNPPVVGLNGAESRINFSPVANSWPTGISIPGADIPTYEFDGNPGDIQLGINSEKREASFHLRND